VLYVDGSPMLKGVKGLASKQLLRFNLLNYLIKLHSQKNFMMLWL